MAWDQTKVTTLINFPVQNAHDMHGCLPLLWEKQMVYQLRKWGARALKINQSQYSCIVSTIYEKFPRAFSVAASCGEGYHGNCKTTPL